MPDESERYEGGCPFCKVNAAENTVLFEGDGFFLMADFAPLSEGHILLIPRDHYPHLAALPQALDEEFERLKAWAWRFIERRFGRLAFWENGIFGQSVPHAHQHILSTRFDTTLFADAGIPFAGLAGLRAAHAARPGTYLTVECDGVARFLPPEQELASKLLRQAREAEGGMWLLRSAERRSKAGPLIEALAEAWREYAAGGG